MVDYFLELFVNICVQLIPLIPAVLVVWLIVDLISGLFFKD